MSPLALIAMLGLLVSQVASLWLIVLAFRTEPRLGVLALMLPMFAISVGNHRIDSPKARGLAIVSWAGLAVFILALVMIPR